MYHTYIHIFYHEVFMYIIRMCTHLKLERFFSSTKSVFVDLVFDLQ